MQPVMTEEELNAYLIEVYPQIFEQFPKHKCTKIQPGRVTVEVLADQRHLRAGGTVSGPTLFSLADMGGYACALSHIGKEALAVTTNLDINFMRKADPGMIYADCQILKMGKRLMVFNASIWQDEPSNCIAFATGTYAIPPSK